MATKRRESPKKFTAQSVKDKTDPGFYPDGPQPNGLYLQIEHAESKQWIYRFMLHGRRREMGLGSYPTIGLAEARSKRDDARTKVKQGIDPIEARKEERRAKKKILDQQITLAEAHEGWRNSGRQLDWNGRDWAGGEGSTAGRETSLWALYGAPHPKAKKPSKKTLPWLGPYQVTELVANKGKLIIEVFTELIGPMNNKKSARYALQHLCKIIEWAIDEKDLPVNNPVNLKRDSKFLRSLPSMDFETEHRRAMPPEMVPAFVARLFNEKHESGMTSADGLALSAWVIAFQIFTAARCAQARLAQWDEFSDLDADLVTWTVPLHTTVNGKRYYRRKRKDKLELPLNSAAVKLLRRLKRHQEENGGLRKFVFSHDPALTAVSEDYHPSHNWRRMENSKYGQSAFRYGGGKPLRPNAVQQFFKNSMGIKDYDLYGFRGSFKQFQINHKVKITEGDPELAGEAVLHHKIGGITRNSYAQQAVPYNAMRELMDFWGAHCESELKKHRLKVVK